jgi:hypothetical protein
MVLVYNVVGLLYNTGLSAAFASTEMESDFPQLRCGWLVCKVWEVSLLYKMQSKPTKQEQQNKNTP